MGIFKKTIKYSKPSEDLDNKIKNLDEELKQTGVINNQDDSEISCIQESSTEKLPEIYDEIEVEKKEESLYNWREAFIIENDETQNIVEETEYKTVRKVESYISESNKELIEIRDQVFQEISESTLLNLPEIKTKIEKVLEIYDQIQEGLLNEPPETKNQDPLTPLNQNFVTTEELNKHYTLFINRIQEQLATVGGGGETRLKYLDDIVGIATNASVYDGMFLSYDNTLGKFKFKTVSGGGGGSQTLNQTLGLGNTSSLGMSVGVVTATSINFASGGVLGDLYSDGGIGIGLKASPANYYAVVASNNLQQFLQVDDNQIFITTGYASTTTGTYDWKFDRSGALTFPDSTVQSTAFTGIATYATSAGITTSGDYAQSGATSAYATKRVLQYNETTKAVTYSNALDAVRAYITGYGQEIHVSPVALDDTGNGTIGDPVKTIARAQVLAALAFETTGVGERKTIILHPGDYAENVTIDTQFTVLTTHELVGKNTTLSGTLTITKGCTIDGLKMNNLVISATSATGSVDIIGCTVTTSTTKTSSAYTVFRGCDLSSSTLSITGTGTVILVGGNYFTVTVNNAAAGVLSKAVVSMGPVTLTAGTLQLSDTLVYSATNTSNAITQSAGSVLTLNNSQTLIPTLTSVARNSFGGFYSILHSVYDKPNSTFGGTSLNSISYSQYINADRIGIGTTNPTSALTVVGNVLVSGIVTATSFSGNATSATYATSAGIATYATSSGIATFATTAGYATTSGISTISQGLTGTPNISVGIITATDTRIQSVAEKTTLVGLNTANLIYNTGGGNIAICTNPSGDITLNVTGIPTDSNFNNYSLAFSVIVTNTGTARSCTAINLNGVSRTIKWFGGSLASAISGVTTSNGYDVYSFTGINTVGSASTTANYIILGSVNGSYR